MASIYILFSQKADKFYIGYSKDLGQRIEYHKMKEFGRSYTAKYDDWELYLEISGISITAAKKIESHIKRMKSKIYIANLKKYPEIIKKLIEKYS